MTRKVPGRHFRKGISLMEITVCPNNEGAGLWPAPLVSNRSGAVRRDADRGRGWTIGQRGRRSRRICARRCCTSS